MNEVEVLRSEVNSLKAEVISLKAKLAIYRKTGVVFVDDIATTDASRKDIDKVKKIIMRELDNNGTFSDADIMQRYKLPLNVVILARRELQKEGSIQEADE